ncbi:MAG TPA: hypothetical protein VFY85_11560 [Gemmatimonadaceae bacterium]|nr:hypothetical protein [Gemmatimonadaceae bacterium]
MSDTEGMVRVMEHAADQLRAAISKQRELVMVTSMSRAEQQIQAQTVAALAFGESTLRLVAASVAPEHATVAAKLREYAGWAESTDDAAPLTKTEIESVVRYLVGVS